MTKTRIVLAAAGILLSFGGSAVARSSHSGGSLSTIDKEYLKDTAQSNLEEIQAGPRVIPKAATPQARSFARRMVQDHTRANAALKRVAARTGDTLPTTISSDQKAIINRLSQMHGSRFDAAYKQEMIRDHTSDIAETRREISLGRNPRVRASAQKNLRLLQMHLKMARALPGR
jgi:putative membrane protein